MPAGIEFHNGDGLTFFTDKRELTGLRINRAEGTRLYPAEPLRGLAPGMTLYRNHDQAFAALLAKPSAERRLGVRLQLRDSASGVTLTLTDEQGVCAQAQLALDKQPANQPERALATLREQLAKLA